MMPVRPFVIASVIFTISAGAGLAQDSFKSALGARQGQMKIIAFNLGVLGSMAKGETEYDATAAQDAADNLVAISQLAQTAQWPEGSDSDSIEGTDALPAIWSDNAGFQADWEEFGVKAAALQSAAGQGAQAIGPAMGGLGGTCKACHDDFRASN